MARNKTKKRQVILYRDNPNAYEIFNGGVRPIKTRYQYWERLAETFCGNQFRKVANFKMADLKVGHAVVVEITVKVVGKPYDLQNIMENDGC